jgi:hypothetical protein
MNAMIREPRPLPNVARCDFLTSLEHARRQEIVSEIYCEIASFVQLVVRYRQYEQYYVRMPDQSWSRYRISDPYDPIQVGGNSRDIIIIKIARERNNEPRPAALPLGLPHLACCERRSTFSPIPSSLPGLSTIDCTW